MKHRFIHYLLILAGTLCLITPAIYNRYPIVYPDTWKYIATCFDSLNPYDRPPSYGWFIWLASLKGYSLWPVIFLQAFIVSWLIFLLVKQVSSKYYLWKGIGAIIFLSLLTGLSWVCSQVMADVSTPICLLCMAIFIFGNVNNVTAVILCLVFFFFSSMHGSHLMTFSVILFIIFLFRKWLLPKQFYPGRWLRILVVFLILLGTIPIIHYSYSKSSHIFFMGAMVEQGILKKYLDDNCGSKNYEICAYKDSLPKDLNGFIWYPKSVLYKSGKLPYSFESWQGETKREYREIIFNTLTTPKYIFLHIKESAKFTWLQLLNYQIGDLYVPMLGETELYSQIKNHFRREAETYALSRQNTGESSFIEPWNKIINWVMLLSLIMAVLLVAIKREIYTHPFAGIILFLVLGLLVSDWACSTFSSIAQRYGCKVAWIVPFFTILALYRFIDLRRKSH